MWRIGIQPGYDIYNPNISFLLFRHENNYDIVLNCLNDRSFEEVKVPEGSRLPTEVRTLDMRLEHVKRLYTVLHEEIRRLDEDWLKDKEDTWKDKLIESLLEIIKNTTNSNISTEELSAVNNNGVD